MPAWRHDSEFGDGERIWLDREQRAVIKARLTMKAFNGPGKLTSTARLVALKLLDLIGKDGALFPAIATIAGLVGKSPDAVQRGLKRLKQLGFLNWTRRLVRIGERVRQRSNAYAFRCGTGTRQQVSEYMNPVPLAERDARARVERCLGGEDRAAAARAVQQLRSLGMHAEADRLARDWNIT